MKNKITKVLAALLTLCMLVGMFVMPVSAEEAIVADETWYKEDADVLYIYDAADLLAFSAAGQENNFEGKTVKLMADIDLNPGVNLSTTIDGSTITPAAKPTNTWKAIHRFAGTFYGNGHIIKGLYSSQTLNNGDKRGGFINHLVGGTIKGVIFLNSVSLGKGLTVGSNTSACVAGVVGDIEGGTIEDLYADIDVWFTDINDTNKGGSVAGLIGKIKDAVCEVDDVVYAGDYGFINDSGEKAGSSSSGQATYYGGIVGESGSHTMVGTIHTLGDVAMLGAAYYKGGAGSSIVHKTLSSCVGVAAVFAINDGDTVSIAVDAKTKCTWIRDSFVEADKSTKPHWNVRNASYTYAERGWVKFVVEDAPFAMRAPDPDTKFDLDGDKTKETSNYDGYYFLPGDVADMIMGNYESTGLYVQKKLDDSAVRFIGVVDVSEAELGNLEALGMNITMTYGEDTYSYSFTTTTVYKSLLANGVKVDVSELNGTYFYAVEITGLNGAQSDVKFDFSGTVKPIGAESVVFASASYTFTPAAN